MNKKQADHLTSEVERSLETLEQLKQLVRDYTGDVAPRTNAPHGLAVGSTVRVYAAIADMQGRGILGDLSEVVSNSPESINAIVEVEVREGALKGERFRVWPQQCILVDSSSVEKDGAA